MNTEIHIRAEDLPAAASIWLRDANGKRTHIAERFAGEPRIYDERVRTMVGVLVIDDPRTVEIETLRVTTAGFAGADEPYGYGQPDSDQEWCDAEAARYFRGGVL